MFALNLNLARYSILKNNSPSCSNDFCMAFSYNESSNGKINIMKSVMSHKKYLYFASSRRKNKRKGVNARNNHFTNNRDVYWCISLNFSITHTNTNTILKQKNLKRPTKLSFLS
jgi:hypothetical protein